MFENKTMKENEKLKVENQSLKRIINIQDKLINNYALRKKEYQNLIFRKTISINALKKSQNESYQRIEESEEEI